MGLIDSLRKAEEHGRDVARKGLEKARDTFAETESRLRRKMRVHPSPREATPEPEPEPLPFSVSPAATSGPAAVESLPHHASEEDAA